MTTEAKSLECKVRASPHQLQSGPLQPPPFSPMPPTFSVGLPVSPLFPALLTRSALPPSSGGFHHCSPLRCRPHRDIESPSQHATRFERGSPNVTPTLQGGPAGRDPPYVTLDHLGREVPSSAAASKPAPATVQIQPRQRPRGAHEKPPIPFVSSKLTAPQAACSRTERRLLRVESPRAPAPCAVRIDGTSGVAQGQVAQQARRVWARTVLVARTTSAVAAPCLPQKPASGAEFPLLPEVGHASIGVANPWSVAAILVQLRSAQARATPRRPAARAQDLSLVQAGKAPLVLCLGVSLPDAEAPSSRSSTLMPALSLCRLSCLVPLVLPELNGAHTPAAP